MKYLILVVVYIISTILIKAESSEFIYAKQIGGTSDDQGYAVTVDSKGNSYTTGIFKGIVDFDPGSGVFNLTSAGGFDIFISKLDADGNFVWAKNMGGTSDDVGKTIKIDASGNVFTSGTFNGVADFDPGLSIVNMTSIGGYDVFISKLDSNGNFKWARSIGGLFNDNGSSLGIDASGNIYLTGTFWDTVDFDTGSNTFKLTSKGYEDIFILKLDGSGNFKWAKSIGGVNTDVANALAIEASGMTYTTGSFDGSVDFDPDTLANYPLVSAGYHDVFILKLDASGQFIWAKKMGGASIDIAYSIALDTFGNIYSTGEFMGPSDFDPGIKVFNLLSGSHDIFILKLNNNGEFIWAKSFGGPYDDDHGLSIALDASENIYITGIFVGTVDFDPGNGVFELTALGIYEMFILKLNTNGSFLWAINLKGTAFNYGAFITTDLTENIYTTGYFAGTADFDPGIKDFDLTANGKTDFFVLKLIDQLTFIQQIRNNQDFIIYPNPSNGQFNVLVSKSNNFMQSYQIEIYNSLGALVFNKKGSGELNTINLTYLTDGLYIIKINPTNGSNYSTFPSKKITINTLL